MMLDGNENNSILFVCTGNRCRSVMASALLSRYLAGEERVPYQNIRSAGTCVVEGQPPTRMTIKLLQKQGIDVRNHQAAAVTEQGVQEAGRILVMEQIHRDYILSLDPTVEGKLRMLSDYVPDRSFLSLRGGIPDPVGLSECFYETVFETISIACRELQAELKTALAVRVG